MYYYLLFFVLTIFFFKELLSKEYDRSVLHGHLHTTRLRVPVQFRQLQVERETHISVPK